MQDAWSRASFDYNGHVIWGATAKIVKQFLDLLGPLPE